MLLGFLLATLVTARAREADKALPGSFNDSGAQAHIGDQQLNSKSIGSVNSNPASP